VLPDEGPAYDERIFAEYAHDARGLCLFRLGRYAEAAAAYEQASRLNPGDLAYRAKWQVALGRAARTSPGLEANGQGAHQQLTAERSTHRPLSAGLSQPTAPAFRPASEQ
jgi:tetratricopeptide (TPR) repeat protein